MTSVKGKSCWICSVHSTWVRICGLMSVLFLCAFLQACVSGDTQVQLPNNAPAIASDASFEEHQQMLRAFGGEYQDSRLKAFLEHIVQKIVPVTDRPSERYRVTILNSQVINAFALPSGRLYVTRGLLALANDSSEIAAVIAHEIAHVTARHAAARTELELRSALVTRVVADVLQDKGSSSDYMNRSKFSIAHFSREQELEADKIGVSTLARAGFDPYGATRFLKSLERAGAGTRSNSDMLSTHPSTKDRINQTLRSARMVGAPGIGTQDRENYLKAINGLVYGDTVNEGLVKGRRFIHTGLHIAFEAPEGFTLENTSKAVLGSNGSTGTRLLFDVVKGTGSLEDILGNTWSDAIEPTDYQSITVNHLTAMTAQATSADWSFRLAALRQGNNVFRLIMASRKAGSSLEAAFQQALNSIHIPTVHEQESLTPRKLGILTAKPGDTATTLFRRMAPGFTFEQFLVLNGLNSGEKLKAGQSYKIVVE